MGDSEDGFISRVDLVDSLLSVQEAFRDLDFNDHPAVRNWREAQDAEAVSEAKEATEADESEEKAKSDLKVDIDPESKSVLDSLLEKFNQESIFGEASPAEEAEGENREELDLSQISDKIWNGRTNTLTRWLKTSCENQAVQIRNKFKYN